MGFLAWAAAWVGRSVAILRIMARTRRLSPSEGGVLYFLISAGRRISSGLSAAAKGAQQPSRAGLHVALGKSPLTAVGFDDFADVDLWFLFRHGFPQSN